MLKTFVKKEVLNRIAIASKEKGLLLSLLQIPASIFRVRLSFKERGGCRRGVLGYL
jgi:hypothetical protein